MIVVSALTTVPTQNQPRQNLTLRISDLHYHIRVRLSWQARLWRAVGASERATTGGSPPPLGTSKTRHTIVYKLTPNFRQGRSCYIRGLAPNGSIKQQRTQSAHLPTPPRRLTSSPSSSDLPRLLPYIAQPGPRSRTIRPAPHRYRQPAAPRPTPIEQANNPWQ